MTESSRAEQIKVANEHGKALAGALGPGWSAKPVEDSWNLGVTLVHIEGFSIYYGFQGRDAGKLYFSGGFHFPHGGTAVYINDYRRDRVPDGKYSTRLASHEVGVSRTKSIDQIARDLQRRLLPDYMAAFTAARNHYLEALGEFESTRAFAESLAALLGPSIKAEPRDKSGTPYSGFEVYEYHLGQLEGLKASIRSGVRLEFGLSRENALRLIGAMKKLGLLSKTPEGA